MFDKAEIKASMTIEDVEQVLELLGASFYREHDDKLVIETICHNDVGVGQKKLYYYTNTKLFNCYSSCGFFDIFGLIQHVYDDYSLDDAIDFVANSRGFVFVNDGERPEGTVVEQDIVYKKQYANDYDPSILDTMPLAFLKEWVEEGISKETQMDYGVRYNARDGAVLFPHHDERGALVGIRQRNLDPTIIRLYGKYRPATLNRKLYSSPLSFYLFGVNHNRWPLSRTKRAIIFEGEKSTMKYGQAVGKANNNSVATFGTSFSIHHFHILKNLGVEEIVFAYDKEYTNATMEDKEFEEFAKKMTRLHKRFNKDGVTVSFMMDRDNLLEYKDAPIDKGLEAFNKMFVERFTLEVKEDEV